MSTKERLIFDNNENKIRNIVYNTSFVFLYSLCIIFRYMFFLNIKDTPNFNHSNNITELTMFLVIGGIFLIIYYLNIFFFKKNNIHNTLNKISSSSAIFFGIAAIVNCVIGTKQFVVVESYISLFINSCFTLLGFGLASIAIILPFLLKEKDTINEKSVITNRLKDLLVSFILFFAMGLIFSLNTLLSLKYINTEYFNAIIYKALFYSVLQIMMIVIEVFVSIINSFIKKQE